LKLTRRRFALLTALSAGTRTCVWAVTAPQPELLAHLDGDFLRIAALHLNFLSGKTLERLKEGASVAFVGQLTISPERNSVVADARSVARFALSYDIWEGKFSVVKIGDRLESRRSTASHLSEQAAEAWCLDNLTLDRSSLPVDRPFYVQLDLRAEDPQDRLSIVGDAGISITRLIDLFTRPPKGQLHWNLSNGPYRLADLRKASRG
jgi:hypothetical protein